MWHCLKCREPVEVGFEICWNCGTSKDGVEDPGFRRADQIAAAEMEAAQPLDPVPGADTSTAITDLSNRDGRLTTQKQPLPLPCPRCDRDMEFVGTKAFHEGIQWGGVLGDWGEFFVNRENLDLYVCRRCGRVEFYLSGVGEHLRPRKMSE